MTNITCHIMGITVKLGRPINLLLTLLYIIYTCMYQSCYITKQNLAVGISNLNLWKGFSKLSWNFQLESWFFQLKSWNFPFLVLEFPTLIVGISSFNLWISYFIVDLSNYNLGNFQLKKVGFSSFSLSIVFSNFKVGVSNIKLWISNFKVDFFKL